MADTRQARDLIEVKRRGGTLDDDDIAFLVMGHLEGSVSEGQMAAFLMAGVINGFSDDEASVLTRTMVGSGDTLDLSGLDGPTVDKHSTGGVADSTTFLVAPLLAAAGAKVVKLSGRGLGHTGGTLDKLEAVPGCRVDLSDTEVLEVARRVGCVVAAQSDTLVPADRAIYALRDETATVDSVALIASSVMSKKIASGAETIVLDVKAGGGAFMTEMEDARALAHLCVRLGMEAGRRTTALVTDMSQPLGRSVGNALEIAETVELLQSEPRGRLAEVALELGSFALSEARSLEGRPQTPAVSRQDLQAHWADGSALERLEHMIAAQGGDAQVVEVPRKILPAAAVVREATLTQGGVVTAVPAREIGRLAARLGAGRARKGEAVDPAVGIEVLVEIGDELEPGAVIGRVHARSEEDAEGAVDRLQSLIGLGDEARPVSPVLDHIIPG